MLSSSLVAVIAQRLVRKLCPFCKKEYESGDMEEKAFGIPKGTRLYESEGCESCHYTGFNGRTLVSEIFLVSDNMEMMISDGRHPVEIKKAAINEGMRTLSQDARTKIISGVTSAREAIRVLS